MQPIFRLIVLLTLLSIPCSALADEPMPPDAAGRQPVAALPAPGEAASGESTAAAAAPDQPTADSSTAGTEAAADGTSAVSAAESADNGKGQTPRRRTGLTPDPNRRWIMKQPKYDSRKSQWTSDKTVEWKGAEQELRCGEYAKALDREYRNARYYSIQGDRCKTAHYSANFLSIVDKCKVGCPDTFLESVGYDGHFIRNMRQLKALGSESCPEQKTPSAADSTAPSAEK